MAVAAQEHEARHPGARDEDQQASARRREIPPFLVGVVEREHLVPGRDEVHARRRARELALEPGPLGFAERVTASARKVTLVATVEQDELHLLVARPEVVARVDPEP